MKKLVLAAAALFVFNTSQAQVEKNITGMQLGLLGLDVYNEARLSDQVALRSQLALNAGIWGGSVYDKTGFILLPELSLEPKYYYNIVKRGKKGKNTKNNGANYLSMQVNYSPNWFAISNYDDLNIKNVISFIPTFGIRRNFAQDFNYEFKFGVGYGFVLGEDGNNGVIPDLSFKVGYDF
ncbi:hypothetical protein EDM00_05515 [Ornithobacterium rhinotracheale]|nr:hypothetical protein [Ornithobacterium rhinotracheale]MRI63447.1 hypothetical protein [Ornithobacterium rhinotracheale]MRJ10388.1 hypothetical protein [Ornithobacterium rhinotracheale]